MVGSRLVGIQVDAEEKAEEDRKNHEFKARPLHIADEDWQTIQNRQTVRRKQRNQMRKEMVSGFLAAWDATVTTAVQETVPWCFVATELARRCSDDRYLRRKTTTATFADVVDVPSTKAYGYARTTTKGCGNWSNRNCGQASNANHEVEVMYVTRADSTSFIQEAATVGPAAFGGETNKEAGGASGTMPIEQFMCFEVLSKAYSSISRVGRLRSSLTDVLFNAPFI